MLFFGHPFDGFASEISSVVVVLGGKEGNAVTFLDGLSFFFSSSSDSIFGRLEK